MIRRKPRRTRWIDWLGCGAIGFIALFFIAAGVSNHLIGTTPEEDLITATGIAKGATVSTVAGRYGATTDFLWFSVEGYRVSYASDQDGYDQVLEAIRSGQEITIGISTKRETLFPRKGWVPLYTLKLGSEPILTYQSTLGKGQQGSNAASIVGAVLLLISSWGLFRCFSYRNLPRT